MGSTCAPLRVFFSSHQPRSGLLSPVINAAAPQGDPVNSQCLNRSKKIGDSCAACFDPKQEKKRDRERERELSCDPDLMAAG